MISPYRNRIRLLRENVIEHVEEVDYETANKVFDALSFFYMHEFVFYSRTIDETENKDLKKGMLEELTCRMDEWKEMIEMQEKWGEIH